MSKRSRKEFEARLAIVVTDKQLYDQLVENLGPDFMERCPENYPELLDQGIHPNALIRFIDFYLPMMGKFWEGSRDEEPHEYPEYFVRHLDDNDKIDFRKYRKPIYREILAYKTNSVLITKIVRTRQRLTPTIKPYPKPAARPV